MAIEIRMDYRHRCTDCGERWWHNGKGEWQPCPEPDQHPCPSCSKPKPKVECGHRCHDPAHARLYPGWRFCPRCGVALTTEGV